MPGRIRVLDASNRTMQRLGYLKPLCVLVNETETSNLASLGRRLIERVTKPVRCPLPLDEAVRDYIKRRLVDRNFRELRKTVLEGDSTGSVSLDIQDYYLADAELPSRTGRLVKENWRRYPYLGTSLELIKKGTYSPLTRSLVLLAVTPKEELPAFGELDLAHNPLRLSDAQRAVLLYCFLDNDGDVLLPFFRKLGAFAGEAFDERAAGDHLPEILRQVIKDHRARPLSPEEKDRLTLLTKTATSIDRWRGKPYTGGGARQETVTVRLEPHCDLGLLQKPDKDRYEYQTTPALKALLESWQAAENTDAFLQQRFFGTFATYRGMAMRPASDAEATAELAQAGVSLKSSLGYSPITDVGLLAGARLLTQKGAVLELARTTELLKALQKRDPEFVRFTVDRMGVMAYVKFLKPAPGG